MRAAIPGFSGDRIYCNIIGSNRERKTRIGQDAVTDLIRQQSLRSEAAIAAKQDERGCRYDSKIPIELRRYSFRARNGAPKSLTPAWCPGEPRRGLSVPSAVGVVLKF